MLNWRATEPLPPPPRALWREPARLLAIAGCLVLVVGTRLPYAEGSTPFDGSTSFGFDNTPNGPFLLLLAITMGVLVLSRSAADSRLLTIRFIPLALGLINAMVWIETLRFAQAAVAHWEGESGMGSVTTAMWVAGIGAAAVALSGTWLSLRHRTSSPPDPDPSARVAISRPAVLQGIGGAIGAIVGAVVGIAVATTLFPFWLFLAHIFAFMYGALMGGYVGIAIGRRLGLR
jgi:hypothetical protein